jgi:hypothetical protein
MIDKPFSFYISYLTNLWLKWMKFNAISVDNKLSYSMRRKSAQLQEHLIKRRYQIIEKLNKGFDNEI